MLTVRQVATVLALLSCACARPVDDRELSPSGFVGREIDPPTPIPDITLTDSYGKPYHLASANPGKVVLLFFGYMHCPDICPVHLANLGAVLKRIPDEIAREVVVVFVTTDPARDSLALLGPWVRGFHPAFVALTGSDSLLAQAQRLAGISFLAERERPFGDSVRADGSYGVMHAAQVIAYTADGMRRAEYPFGTRQSDWAHDLPLLVRFGKD